jgi:3-oxoacyl-[acyl-carrier protein] reductase
MQKKNYGKIIITSSVGGKMSHPTAGVHYISSKGALLAFTRHFANQVGQYGITVNAIAPGTTETPLIKHRNDEIKKAIAKKIPMLRLGYAQEMAGAVLFLASDCSGFVTGEIMDINGGLYID